MRGKVYDWDIKTLADGITPAYAGKSYNAILDLGSCTGSPPPMRGKDREVDKGRNGRGITPAYAGKSFFDSKFSPPHRDHPRLCGEKYNIRSIYGTRQGSPPPMRGKAEPMQIVTDLIRITPAYAGKSVLCNHLLCQRKDHPRLCGEKKIR